MKTRENMRTRMALAHVVVALGGTLALATTASADYFTNWSGANKDGWVGSGDTVTAFTLDATGTWFAPSTITTTASDFLTSPIFIVDDLLSVAFDFAHRYDLAGGFDGGVVEINVNGGGFMYFAMPDYDFTLPADNPIGQLMAYSGVNTVLHSSGNTINLTMDLVNPLLAGVTMDSRKCSSVVCQ